MMDYSGLPGHRRRARFGVGFVRWWCPGDALTAGELSGLSGAGGLAGLGLWLVRYGSGPNGEPGLARIPVAVGALPGWEPRTGLAGGGVRVRRRGACLSEARLRGRRPYAVGRAWRSRLAALLPRDSSRLRSVTSGKAISARPLVAAYAAPTGGDRGRRKVETARSRLVTAGNPVGRRSYPVDVGTARATLQCAASALAVNAVLSTLSLPAASRVAVTR